MGILEKVRPNLPVKPLPTKKTPVSEYKEEKTVKGTKPATNSKVVKPKVRNRKCVLRILANINFRHKLQQNRQAAKRRKTLTRRHYYPLII